jgi:hypothetical protein
MEPSRSSTVAFEGKHPVEGLVGVGLFVVSLVLVPAPVSVAVSTSCVVARVLFVDAAVTFVVELDPVPITAAVSVVVDVGMTDVVLVTRDWLVMGDVTVTGVTIVSVGEILVLSVTNDVGVLLVDVKFPWLPAVVSTPVNTDADDAVSTEEDVTCAVELPSPDELVDVKVNTFVPNVVVVVILPDACGVELWSTTDVLGAEVLDSICKVDVSETVVVVARVGARPIWVEIRDEVASRVGTKVAF